MSQLLQPHAWAKGNKKASSYLHPRHGHIWWHLMSCMWPQCSTVEHSLVFNVLLNNNKDLTCCCLENLGAETFWKFAEALRKWNKENWVEGVWLWLWARSKVHTIPFILLDCSTNTHNQSLFSANHNLRVNKKKQERSGWRWLNRLPLWRSFCFWLASPLTDEDAIAVFKLSCKADL